MADNVPITAGTGTTVATDQLATGEHVQFVKLMDGTLDSTTKVGATANGLKVDGSAVTQPVSGTVAVSGTVTTTFAGAVSVNPTGETAGVGVGAAADTSATNSVIGLLKKLIGLFPAALGAGGGLKVDGSGTALPVSGTVTANAGSGPFPVSDNAGSLTVDNAGTFAVQDSEKVADNAAFTDGTTKVQPAGYIFDEVAGTALTENDAAAARIDSKRAQVGVIEDATTRGQRATVSAAGALKVDGSAVTQPISAASLPLPSTASTDASVTGLQVAQASTTSGQKGTLVQGAVTTAAPTYTTAQTDPLSLTTGGALRSDLTTIAGTAPSTAGKVDVKGADGDVFVRQATAANLNATVEVLTGTLAGLTVKRAFANPAASGTDTNIITAVASKKLRVLAAIMVAGGTATNLTFNSKPAGAGTAISPLFANAANGGAVLPFMQHGWFETNAGEGLTVTTGAGSTTGVLVVYVEV